MKNIYLFILSFVFITSANSQVIRYTLMDVDSKDREKFETALANKTKRSEEHTSELQSHS